jgi:selenocysteine lyase/cysteine desulfurase
MRNAFIIFFLCCGIDDSILRKLAEFQGEKEMEWKKIEELYPVNKKMIWLNNCGTTPSGDHIKEEIISFMTSYSENGVLTPDFPYHAVLRDIQNSLSRLLNCDREDVALIQNTAEGMNLISHGFHFKPGDEVLLLENEYPSNVYPWEHLGKKGVRIKFVSAEDTPEGFFTGLEKAVTGKTALISLSAVHWCTGMPLPLKKIADLCRERDILFVLDAAQGAGHVPIDLKELDCVTAFSAWKWLMGPLGLGVLVIPKHKLPLLDPVFKGTGSVVNELEYFPYRDELKPAAERYIYSTPGIMEWVYFRESLRLLDSIGMDKVRGRIYELADITTDMLRSRGFILLKDRFSEKTGIVAAVHPGYDSARTVKELKRRGVVAAERLGRVRFAPHIYNSPEQIERVGEILDGILS